jgi:hypothetical protein
MQRNRKLAFAVVLLSCVAITGVGAGATPATAAPDKTPPTLQVMDFPLVTKGQQLPWLTLYAEGGEGRFVLRWSASDDGSGLCRVMVFQGDFQTDPVLTEMPDPATAEYSGLGDHFAFTNRPRTSGSISGIDVMGFHVVAEDCAGNWSYQWVYALPALLDQDATQVFEDQTYNRAQVTRTGSWDTSHYSGWVNGTTWKTSDAGASATYDFNELPFRHMQLGVVMATGPDRGSAQILVNGKVQTTVDTYSAQKGFRQVMTSVRLPGRTPTVSIVNAGSPGHARIDIDAFVMQSFAG